MAKLIIKCRYLKANNPKHSENLIHYISKRDGVEKTDDSWKSLPETKSQKKLIEELISDFPDTINDFEYTDYTQNHTKETASEFINHVIENNVDIIGKRENYIEYISKRPRVEKQDSHGLFTDDKVPINLSAVAKEVANHKGNVWTDIISLRREDAVRLGYDKGESWRNLIRSQIETIATSMKIPLEDLRWYAAFHNESYHPHVHIVAYSVGKEPYMSEQGILKMKSAFAREIFKQDLIQVYTEQTKQRDILKGESKNILSEIIEDISDNGYNNETIELMLKKLSEQLANTKGKKVYGYLPQKTRNLVNGIIDEFEKDPRIKTLYDLWYEQKEKVIRTYTDNIPERIPLSRNKEFKVIKNAVIQESLKILYNRTAFKDVSFESETFAHDISEKQDESKEETNMNNKTANQDHQYSKSKESSINGFDKYYSYQARTSSTISAFRLLVQLSQMFQDKLQQDNMDTLTDKKLNQKIRDKKISQGLK